MNQENSYFLTIFRLFYHMNYDESLIVFFRAEKDLIEHLAVTTSWDEFCTMLENKKVFYKV